MSGKKPKREYLPRTDDFAYTCDLCPDCHERMYYSWPSMQMDSELERIAFRFQECRNEHCGNSAITDVLTGQVFWIAKPRTFTDFVDAYIDPGIST